MKLFALINRSVSPDQLTTWRCILMYSLGSLAGWFHNVTSVQLFERRCLWCYGHLAQHVSRKTLQGFSSTLCSSSPCVTAGSCVCVFAGTLWFTSWDSLNLKSFPFEQYEHVTFLKLKDSSTLGKYTWSLFRLNLNEKVGLSFLVPFQLIALFIVHIMLNMQS